MLMLFREEIWGKNIRGKNKELELRDGPKRYVMIGERKWSRG